MPHLECVYAAAGGLGINLLNLIELKNVPKNRRPDLKDPLYWLYFVITPLLGAGLAFLYDSSNIKLQPILAANIGASAPLILRSMASVIPPETKSKRGA